MRSLALAAALLSLSAAGCDHTPPPPKSDECGPVRTKAVAARQRFLDLNAAAPAPDAALPAIAAHADLLAKTSRDIAGDLGALKPARADLAESAEGVRMLGDLSGRSFEALAATLHGLEGRLGRLTDLENAANDAAQGIGPEAAPGLGCAAGSKAGGCDALDAALSAIDRRPSVPLGLADAARESQARAALLDAVAQATSALAAAPPKQKARDDLTQKAKAAAAAFHALGQALGEAAPLQEKLGAQQQEAETAAIRLVAEVDAAARLCGAPPVAPPSAAPAAPPASTPHR
jgi:hypothetical protein